MGRSTTRQRPGSSPRSLEVDAQGLRAFTQLRWTKVESRRLKGAGVKGATVTAV